MLLAIEIKTQFRGKKMMGKGSCCDKNGLKKGAWTEDEDKKLTAYITRYGHWNWGLLPQFAGMIGSLSQFIFSFMDLNIFILWFFDFLCLGVSRSGKSCRLRWMNHLRPNMKHGNFTEDEDNVIISLQNKIGNKWTKIAAKLPGRSDNEIKNRWNVHLKKRVQRDQVSGSEHTGTLEPDQANLDVDLVKETDVEFQHEDGILFPGVPPSEPSSSSSSSSTELLSCWLNGIDSAGSSDLTPQTFDDEMVGDFWTEPFIPDNEGSIPLGDNLWSPFNFVNDFIYQSSCQDMFMIDEVLRPTLDTYVEDNVEIN
ncbi:putative transcription factor MYB-HB-like family [Helianthus annuus]|nr:putative transcription factor MYB-HB-like family [Helianthus annuus]